MKPVTVVPSTKLHQLAEEMVLASKASSSADAVLERIEDVEPSQYAALLVALVGLARGPGAPRTKFRYNATQRREAHRLYRQGDRAEWVREAEREYQRAHKRAARRRKATGDQLSLAGGTQ